MSICALNNMGQRSFIIIVIIGCILIGIAAAANYCQLCRNHVACRPKRGFGRACGKRHAVVQLGEGEQKLILQIHNGLRSVVASGLLKGFQPAARMGHIQWNSELAKLAAINARQCYVHYDRCRKTVQFPWSGQNIGMDQATNKYRATNQSIYLITLKWFRQYEQANADGMNSFRVPKIVRKRFTNFATLVHDRQTHIGCAAVKFRKGRFFNFNLVCNYAMRVLANRKVYETGIPYSGCKVGRSVDYPSLCATSEPIKAVAYPKVADNVLSSAISPDGLWQQPSYQEQSYQQPSYQQQQQQQQPSYQQQQQQQQPSYQQQQQQLPSYQQQQQQPSFQQQQQQQEQHQSFQQAPYQQQSSALQTPNLNKAKRNNKRRIPTKNQRKQRTPNRIQTRTQPQYRSQSNAVFNPFGFFG